MNQVILFNDITTESALLAIEAYSLKYNADIVADMNDEDDRRVIKKEASEIADMRKAVERARIDKKKVYGKQVDKEALIIDGRLAKANKPFDVLINNYNAERKLILDAENARKKAIEDQAAIDSDYEIAVLLMDKYFNDKAQAEIDKMVRDEALRLEGAQQAKQALIDAEDRRLADIAAEKQRGIDERIQQEFDAEQLRIKAASDADHVASVHRNIKAVFMAAGLDEQSSVTAVKLLVAGKLPHVKLTY
jgi:hypothetical protein